MVVSTSESNRIKDNHSESKKVSEVNIDEFEQFFETFIKNNNIKEKYMTDKLQDRLRKHLNFQLLPHQQYALNWMITRENHNQCPGGILADDMGLGKTITTLALIIASTRKSDIINSTTLIVTPASIIYNWEFEIKKHIKFYKNKFNYDIFHGDNFKKYKSMHSSEIDNHIQKYCIILTTYNMIQIYSEIFNNIHWKRVILDEGHSIKNPLGKQSQSICQLKSQYRWILTGTPIQNRILEFYALVKFLRIHPINTFAVWKKFFPCTTTENGKNSKKISVASYNLSIKRARMLSSVILLRRMKNDQYMGKPLIILPEKRNMIHRLTLNRYDREFYEALKYVSKSCCKNLKNDNQSMDIFKCRWVFTKTNEFKVKFPSIDINSILKVMGINNLLHDYNNTNKKLNIYNNETLTRNNTYTRLLILCLRLRQSCCHLRLLTNSIAMDDYISLSHGNSLKTLNKKNDDIDGLIDMMDSMNLDRCKSLNELVKNNPKFNDNYQSTKVNHLLNMLKDISKEENPFKCVVVSQWTSFLDIIHECLIKLNYNVVCINGKTRISDRLCIVEKFNSSSSDIQILLLSLKAGGVGLNLTGANHLFHMDQHWNPSLEDQASDRIYRIGQKRNVAIHRYICENTIEEYILNLQLSKRSLAENIINCTESTLKSLTFNELVDMISGL